VLLFDPIRSSNKKAVLLSSLNCPWSGLLVSLTLVVSARGFFFFGSFLRVLISDRILACIVRLL
jgi:hypothetical protein